MTAKITTRFRELLKRPELLVMPGGFSPNPAESAHDPLHARAMVLDDGTTTLVGTSWYTLHVRPLWYFDLWTSDMTRAVHLRVMRHVRRLAANHARYSTGRS